MLSRVNIVCTTVLALALGLLVQTAGPRPAAAQREAPGRVLKPGPPAQPPAMVAPQPALPSATILKGEQLTRPQFEALPDSALIEVKGQRVTKAQIKAQILTKAARRREAQAKAQAAAGQAKAKFEQRRAQFEQAQQAKLQADNAKVLAELARVRPRAAIEHEAAQLFNRSKTASSAERTQIDQRASQLLQQLKQMGR